VAADAEVADDTKILKIGVIATSLVKLHLSWLLEFFTRLTFSAA
jgi:hypothetical protein